MNDKMTETLAQNIIHALAQTPAGCVNPLVVVRRPGIGILHALKGIAADLELAFLDARCDMLSPFDFTTLPVLRDGQMVRVEPSLAYLRHDLQSGRDVLLVLDDATVNGVDVPAAILAQAGREAKGRVVAVLMIMESSEEDAVKAIGQGLGMLETQSEPVPESTILRFLPTEADMLASAVAYGRTTDMDGEVLDFLEARGDFAGASFRAWVQFSTLRPQLATLDAHTRAVVCDGYLGREAFEAFEAWTAKRGGEA